MQVQPGTGNPIPGCTPSLGALVTRVALHGLDCGQPARHRAVSAVSISASASCSTIAACIVG